MSWMGWIIIVVMAVIILLEIWFAIIYAGLPVIRERRQERGKSKRGRVFKGRR